ncbi:MAG: alpha/beta hydrolase family protein [Gemmataceae bacterium]|nr:alpha/beta hydrolase family protein [Gemmataceae bacterium]MDW8265036.1 alpha/beta hydrolase family protein [Gemmataceae bacterium]
MRPVLACVVAILGPGPLLGANPAALPVVETGRVTFRPLDDQRAIPERYRLGPLTFEYTLSLKAVFPASGVEVYRLTFPSPVQSPHPENNTVHAEYYRPRAARKFPCVIVLDITGGDQSVSRTIATHLASKGIGGLFVQMAYYGPRRPPGSGLRLLSYDYPHTLNAIRQTVLDLRCATAWMEDRPEIDAGRLGILGTSLGSFIGTLTAEMEPKLRRVAVLLGGGGLVDAYYDDPRAAPYRKLWEALGGSRAKLAELIAPVDPITYAENLKTRRVLILAAARDDIVPPSATRALWKATGEQKIVWFDCTHYGAVLYLAPALKHVVEHFAAE